MISSILQDRVNTRCFSDKEIPTEIIQELLEVLNRIPVKENQVPTNVYVLGKNATAEKEEFYINTECAPKVFNPQVLAPLTFCFSRKSEMLDGNGTTDLTVPEGQIHMLHRMYCGMASMAIALSAIDQGLQVGFCQSGGIMPWKHERGGSFQHNGEKVQVELSLGVGYAPDDFTHNQSRIRHPYEKIKDKPQDWLERQQAIETNPRPQLADYVYVIGQDINLPETWQPEV